MATRVVDIHAHMLIPEVETLVRDHPDRTAALQQTAVESGNQSSEHNAVLFRDVYRPKLTDVDVRLRSMNEMGVDMQAISISPTRYYYWADDYLARDIATAANSHIAAVCEQYPDRFVGLAAVSLQHAKLAAEQLKFAVTELGLRGCQISTRIAGKELSDAAHDVFWRTAEELEAVVFVHPLGCSLAERVDQYYLANCCPETRRPGEFLLTLRRSKFAFAPRPWIFAARGFVSESHRVHLVNSPLLRKKRACRGIHAPDANSRPFLERNLLTSLVSRSETTIALSHLIFGGTLDRYPGLRICAAHGGGYLPSYVGRSDHGYAVRPEAQTIAKPPSEYLRQIWFDSLVYTPHALEHLVHEVGAAQVVVGTDYPFDMGVDNPLSTIAEANLSDADRDRIRGENAMVLLKISH